MTFKKPNFFIVGAAKSATTAIYHYLKEHPDIFLSELKEPRYLSYNLKDYPHNGPGDEIADEFTIKNQSDYYALFENVRDEKIIGEASVDYLYFKKVAKSIDKKYPEAKVLIILRNPVERAYSAYMHLVRDNREDLSFEAALSKEEIRKKNNYEFIWHYKSVSEYYSQVKKYIDVLGEDKVKVVLFEDIKDDIESVLNEILIFLNIESDFEFKKKLRHNVSGVPKNNFIHNILQNKSLIKTISKFIIPKNFRKIIRLKIMDSNLKKPKININTREYLVDYFKNDILKLQNLINRDLSDWLSS